MFLVTDSTLQSGKYRILSLLGQGGFGITYLAEHTTLERKVAIKEFFMKDVCNREENSHVSVPSVGSKELVEGFKKKFIKEARLIATFNNPYIIKVFDVFEENGTAYYVMEYLEGASLASILSASAMDEEEAVKYVRQVAGALSEVHSRNLLHLDVKPANIMLNEAGEAVLIDFGISKHYDDSGSQTSSGLVGISDGYAPIEQYRKGGISSFSPATDIYSLGATLYKLLTGKTPPHASDVYDEGLPPLPDTISVNVRCAIEAAMQPRRKDRPQSAMEFIALLDGRKYSAPVMSDANDSDCVRKTVAIEGEETRMGKIQKEANADETMLKVPVTEIVGNDVFSASSVKEAGETSANHGEKMGGSKVKLVIPLVVLLCIVVGLLLLLTLGLGEDEAGLDYADVDESIEYCFEDKGLSIFVDENGKHGFSDADGNIVVPCKYDYVKDYSDGVATVELAGKWGVIDGNGTVIVPCKYDYVRFFHSGIAGVRMGEKWSFIDRYGNQLTDFIYDGTEECIEGMAFVVRDGKSGFVDSTGIEVIPCIYDYSKEAFENGKVEVELNGERFFIDRLGQRMAAERKALPPPPEAKEIVDIIEIVEEEIVEEEIVEEEAPGDVYIEEGNEEEIFQVVEQQPEFPGGMKALAEYYRDNIKYPRISQENGSQGRAFIRFVVNADGSIQDVEVVKSTGDVYLDNEAVRVVEAMPKWSPGRQSGKPVRVYFTLPVNFRLQ